MNDSQSDIYNSYDTVLRDKNLINIIGNKKVKIDFPDPFKISIEDEKEFGQIVRKDRTYEYKNLLNRIDLHCDLLEFGEAKKLIDEANSIYHNYHILLSYNALCEYALSDISKLTLDNRITNRIVKLLNTAKDQKSDSQYYHKISAMIGQNFYDFINSNIEKLLAEAPRDWIRATPERQKLYYNAIAKHIIQLETCFEIHQDTQYLENCVNHLSGQKKYAWIKINADNTEEDFGRFYFEEGTRFKLLALRNKIRIYKKDYELPELLFGNYFEEPSSKRKIISTKKRNYT